MNIELLLKQFGTFLNLNITSEQIKDFLKYQQEQKQEINKPIIIYTDGACLGNGKLNAQAGLGIYFETTDQSLSINVKEILNDYFPHLKNIKLTNNIAELLAIFKALLLVISILKNKHANIEIKTDSMYCIKIFTEWYLNWEKRNWTTTTGKPVLNKDIIVEIVNIIKTSPYTIKFIHVPAHTTEPIKTSPKYKEWYGNKMADDLARHGASMI